MATVQHMPSRSLVCACTAVAPQVVVMLWDLLVFLGKVLWVLTVLSLLEVWDSWRRQE